MSAETLLINLTRLGDLLQTQPVISGLAARGRRVGLVCQENFSAAAELLADVHEVYPLPGAKLLALLDKQWPSALEELHSFKSRARSGQVDQVLNLTATLAARVLSRYLAGDAALSGYSLDDHGFELTDNPWAVLLVACTKHRGLSPFNLVDLFWKASGLPDEPRSLRLAKPDDGDAASAIGRLRSLADSDSGYIAIQLGASDDRRRWPVERFAAAAESLFRSHGVVPALLGSQGERALAEKFRELYPAGYPLADLVGSTNLKQLAATLVNCRLLLTNDTGTMHLAAGLVVPIISIFLATAQSWDTGPYLPGSLCLEPDMACHPCPFGAPCPHENACRWAIPAEIPTRLAASLLDRQRPSTVGDMTGARIWETEVQERHFLGLRSLSGHEQNDRTRWIRQQRHFYRSFLDGETITTPQGTPPSGPLNREVLNSLEQASMLLTLLRGQAEALSISPRQALKQKFLASWEHLRALLTQSPQLYVLGHLLLHQTQQDQDLAAVNTLLARYQHLTDSWRDALIKGGTQLEYPL